MTVHAPIALPHRQLAAPGLGDAAQRPALVAASALAAWAVSTWLLWNVPLNNDVSWQYWLARQLLGGARYGSDVIEVNPPLWFWEAMPLSALADALGFASDRLVVAATMARTVLCVALTAVLVGGSAARRWILASGLFVTLVALPIFTFAEREHGLLLGALPYAALIARRVEGSQTDRRLILLVSVIAAWSFALKPYFALIPLCLELWLAWRLRRAWRPLRIETVTLAATAIGYGAAILLFAPDYLAHMLPLARAFYADFAPPFARLFTMQVYLPMWLLGGVALLIARPRSVQARAAIVTTAAVFACYLIQGKGFPYHALPVTVGLVWALWLTIVETGALPTALARRPLATAAIVLAFATAALVGPFRAPTLGSLDRTLDRLPRGTVFAAISAHNWYAFPFVEERGFVWPLATGNPMMGLRTILREGEGPSATAPGRMVRDWTLGMLTDGLTRCPADVLLIDDPADSPMLVGTGADYLGFLRSEPRTAAILAAYRPIARDGRKLLLARDGPMPPRSACPSAPAIPTRR